jgi:hypothetical protein
MSEWRTLPLATKLISKNPPLQPSSRFLTTAGRPMLTGTIQAIRLPPSRQPGKFQPHRRNDDGQTLFQFNSIEPATYDSILQPVLQYGVSADGGGEFWAVASWYVTGNQSFVSKLTSVATGQSLTGVIKLLSQKNSLANYSCRFTGITSSNLTIKNISPLVWLAEVLEVYSVDTCADYPNTPFSEMSKIDVKIKNTTPSVTWGVSSGDPSCGVTTTVVTQGGKNAAVDIYY